MPRRHPATALLALAALLGTGGPAAAEGTPRAMAVEAEPSLPARGAGSSAQVSAKPREAVPASISIDATTRPSGASDLGAPPQTWDDAGVEAWEVRIEDRLATLSEAAEAHAAQRPEHAAASTALLRRLEALAAGLHDPAAIGLGIAVRDLDTCAPVFEHGAELGLNPASNQKLLTAVAALELLGDDYRFETRVLRAGDALVLRGEGDPSLQIADLERLAAEVATAIDLGEIRRVIVDDTAFSPRRFGPGYDPDGSGPSYMAPSGALSLQWSTVEVRVRGAAAGHPLHVEVSPPCEHVQVRSTASGGRGAVAVQSAGEGEHTVITGDGSR